jgi:uncharacterized membrane protein
MVLWAGILGAIIGWILADFESFGFFGGGILGLLAGWTFRKAVRAEIAAVTAPLEAKIQALLAGQPQPQPQPQMDQELAAEPAKVADIAQEAPESPAAEAPEPHILYVGARSAAQESVNGRAAVERQPSPPGAIETMVSAGVSAVKGWLFGGNTIVRVGLLILFVGLSFLASYAASAGLFPIELRLTLIAGVGIALLIVGFRTRIERPGFGLALQGAGIATIYLTLFAAARLYETFPIAAAFLFMIVICALGCALALLQRSQALAVTAFAGGFAVPLLLGGKGGAIIGVFVYYTILNLAILFIAQRRSWRILNLVGFFATFGAATLWGTTSYQPSDFAAAQFFLILSILIYVATAILYTRATPGSLGNVVDTTLLFGPALAGFGLQVGLVHDQPFGSAFAAIGFALLYLGVAAFLMRYRRESFQVMNETMLAIGIGFVTMAVPLALGARWTSAVWALEGAGAFWVGMRQARWMPRMFGIGLQLIAALVYLGSSMPNISAMPVANPGFVGAMLIALAALITAWWLRQPLPHSGSAFATYYARAEAVAAKPAFLFGFLFWLIAWAAEIFRLLPATGSTQWPFPAFDPGQQIRLCLIAYVVSAWILQVAGQRLKWAVARWPSHASLLALTLAFLSQMTVGEHILGFPGARLWIAAIGLHLRMLYVNDAAAIGDGKPSLILHGAHVGGVWLATAILADSLWLAVDRAGLWQTSWAEVIFLASSAAVLAVLTFWAGRAIRQEEMGSEAASRRWPLERYAVAYGYHAAVPIAGLTLVGTYLTATLSSGVTDPLPYLPLTNPVDLVLGLALATLELWRRSMSATALPAGGRRAFGGKGAQAAIAGLAFLAVNTVWLRLAHHMLGVSWSADALLGSFVVQTGLAILWTLLALGLMIVAHRRAHRTLWLVGAALLGLTVVKLLLIDLNSAAGGARIVAFIVVGLLMLVVGYLAPLPPRTPAVPGEEGQEAA